MYINEGRTVHFQAFSFLFLEFTRFFFTGALQKKIIPVGIKMTIFKVNMAVIHQMSSGSRQKFCTVPGSLLVALSSHKNIFWQ